MNATDTVRAAIKTTRRALPEHWEGLLAQRSVGSKKGAGSVYAALPEDILEMLLRSEWEEASHPDVMPGCSAYTAELSGMTGVVSLADLPDDAELELRDGHSTGKVELVVVGYPPERRTVPQTWLIIGQEEGEDVVFTFHPGEPVRPSEIPATVSGRVTKAEAQKMGFVWVKVGW